MIKKTFLALWICAPVLFSQTNVDLVSNLNPYPSIGYNDIWGYVDGQGIEYALLGTRHGTSIIRLDTPSNPQEVAFIPGPPSIWRDIKVHNNYAYIITEQTGTGQGLQIIELSSLPNSAMLVETIDTWFVRAHNIFIDNGYAYVIGTEGGGGMHILDLSNPISPVRTAYYSASGYIHDVYVWDDTLVACAGSSGQFHLVDVSDKSNPQFISASPSIPGIYAHAGWMTENKRYFYGTEEFNQVDITVWDLQDRFSWELVIPTWETNSDATVHNLLIHGNYAHISYYYDGYVILDISNPEAPYLIGQYDTTPINRGTLDGAWGVYPYLPSGLTIISDTETGLYVFQFTPGDVPPTILHTEIDDVLNNDPITISANIVDNDQIVDPNMHYRTTFEGSTSEWFLVNDPDGPTNNIYEFEIPGQDFVKTVEYYLAAVDNNNNVTTLPSGGSGINPPGAIPPPELFSFKVINPGIPIITSFFPLGDTTINKNDEIDFEVVAIDTSGLELNYQWYNDDFPVGTNTTYHYRHSSFDPPPHTDVIKVVISNGYFTTENIWNVFVQIPTSVEDENNILSYNLNQNYPNPFNPTTQINFSIPKTEFVNLSVYNSLGEKVSELVNETKPPGKYSVRFDASNLSSGIYIAKITAGNFNQLIKMALSK
ncbi:MAG: choice-of-anchor B family protein [Ignavibacterium sp.]|nr:MAG: choice-of-anchor B family protein [Ignavibacterium sp.]